MASSLRSRSLALAALAAAAVTAVCLWPNADAPPPAPPATSPAAPAAAAAADATVSPPTIDRTAAPLPTHPTTGNDDRTPRDRERPARSPTHTVLGRVVDARGAGIAGATVATLREDQEAARVATGLPRELLTGTGVTTAADGAFVLPLSGPGPATLFAAHPEHPPTEHPITIDQPRTEGLVLVLRDGGAITGRIVGAPADAGELTVVAHRIEDRAAAAVVDAARRQMFDLGPLLEGLEVPLGQREALAAADGSFRLGGLAHATRYRVYACRRENAGLPVRCTAPVEVLTGAGGVELPWRASLTLVLRVLDADTGRPLEELDVAVGPVRTMKVMGMSVPVPMRSALPRRHYPGGLVELPGLPIDTDAAHQLSLEVRAKGHRSWTRDDVDGANAGRHDLGTVQLPAAPVVRVVVTSAGQPLAGAKVELAPAESAQPTERRSLTVSTTVRRSDAPGAPVTTTAAAPTTDAQGVAEVTADFTGEAHLVVTAADHARHRSEPFQLPPRGVVERAVTLLAGGTVVVQVRDGHGAPLAAYRVQDHDPTGETTVQTSDAAGLAQFRHLTPGEHTFTPAAATGDGLQVQFSGADRASDRRAQRVLVVDGGQHRIELVEPLRGTVRGTVTLDGEPLDRAEVMATDQPMPAAADEAAAEIGAAVTSLMRGMLGQGGSPDVRTDDDGTFRLADVPVGPTRLVVRHKLLAMPALLDVTVTEGDNVHDFVLRATTVRGRILGHDGAPLAGATVQVAVDTADGDRRTADGAAVALLGNLFGAAPKGVRSDADGRFELRHVRPDTPLRVSASAHLHVNGSVAVAPLPTGGRHDGVELRLAGAGRVRVRSSLDGTLSVDAHWAGADTSRPAVATVTALFDKGRATLDGLAPGRWRIALDGAAPAKGQERFVDVGLGGTATIEF